MTAITSISNTVLATESEFRAHLPFAKKVIVKKVLSDSFNWLFELSFPYHMNVVFRVVDDSNAFLLFMNYGHVKSYLFRNGLPFTSPIQAVNLVTSND